MIVCKLFHFEQFSINDTVILFLITNNIAQSAGTVENTDCTSAEG